MGSLFLTTGDSSYIESTIIDADNLSNVVTFNNGETNDAQLIGLTLQRGYTGIFIQGSNPTLKNLIVTNNSSIYDGSVLTAECNPNASFIIDGCTFINNNYANYVISSCNINNNDPSIYPVIKNTKIINNLPNNASLKFYGEKTEVENSIIANNSGYGIEIIDAGFGTSVTNSTIAKNSLGAINNSSNNFNASFINVKNSILYNEGDYELATSTQVPPTIFTIDNSIVRNEAEGILALQTTTVNYANTNMGYEPSFISETDFKLSDYSPALGAGTSDGAPLKDIIGNDRPLPAGSTPDIGAYENALGSPFDSSKPIKFNC